MGGSGQRPSIHLGAAWRRGRMHPMGQWSSTTRPDGRCASPRRDGQADAVVSIRGRRLEDAWRPCPPSSRSERVRVWRVSVARVCTWEPPQWTETPRTDMIRTDRGRVERPPSASRRPRGSSGRLPHLETWGSCAVDHGHVSRRLCLRGPCRARALIACECRTVAHGPLWLVFLFGVLSWRLV